ncbi:uncharacterized protein DS421_4g110480 [Arachis hypogaea]|nr:uncharacterized protein DS421_4g110480 [Arachis hypogaea]
MARQIQQMLENVRKHHDHLTICAVSRTELTEYRPGRRSIPFKSLDRKATMTETFKYTHMLKENKEIFAD